MIEDANAARQAKEAIPGAKNFRAAITSLATVWHYDASEVRVYAAVLGDDEENKQMKAEWLRWAGKLDSHAYALEDMLRRYPD